MDLDIGALCSRRHDFSYTHFQNAAHTHLDLIYASVGVLRAAHNYCVQPIFFTDHCFVSVKVGRKENPTSRFDWRLWKLNRTLLTDQKFADIVRQLLCTMAKRETAISEAREVFQDINYDVKYPRLW